MQTSGNMPYMGEPKDNPLFSFSATEKIKKIPSGEGIVGLIVLEDEELGEQLFLFTDTEIYKCDLWEPVKIW